MLNAARLTEFIPLFRLRHNQAKIIHRRISNRKLQLIYENEIIKKIDEDSDNFHTKLLAKNKKSHTYGTSTPIIRTCKKTIAHDPIENLEKKEKRLN